MRLSKAWPSTKNKPTLLSNRMAGSGTGSLEMVMLSRPFRYALGAFCSST